MSTLPYRPGDFTAKTILGATLDLEAQTGVQRKNDTQSTINAKRNVHPSIVPTLLPTVGLFGVGIGGRRIVSTAPHVRPNMVRTDSMDLYNPLPIRAVPIEEDLSPQERALYRMRELREISGQIYCLYWLKVFTFQSMEVDYTVVVNDAEAPYNLDYANLNPTPPVPNINGIQTDPSRAINVDVKILLPITGAEVAEAIGLFYDGDMAFASISEYGLYSGRDQTVTGLNADNQNFNYTESVMTQLYLHHTNTGSDFSLPQNNGGYRLRLSRGDLLALNV